MCFHHESNIGLNCGVCVYAINNMDSQLPFWIRYYFGPIMIQLIEQLCSDKFGIILGKLLTPHNRNRGERVIRLLPDIPGIMPSCQSLAVSKSIEWRLNSSSFHEITIHNGVGLCSDATVLKSSTHLQATFYPYIIKHK